MSEQYTNYVGVRFTDSDMSILKGLKDKETKSTSEVIRKIIREKK